MITLSILLLLSLVVNGLLFWYTRKLLEKLSVFTEGVTGLGVVVGLAPLGLRSTFSPVLKILISSSSDKAGVEGVVVVCFAVDASFASDLARMRSFIFANFMFLFICDSIAPIFTFVFLPNPGIPI